jgi:hypothetical protein
MELPLVVTLMDIQFYEIGKIFIVFKIKWVVIIVGIIGVVTVVPQALLPAARVHPRAAPLALPHVHRAAPVHARLVPAHGAVGHGAARLVPARAPPPVPAAVGHGAVGGGGVARIMGAVGAGMDGGEGAVGAAVEGMVVGAVAAVDGKLVLRQTCNKCINITACSDVDFDVDVSQ